MTEIDRPFLYEMVPVSKLAVQDVIYLNDDQLRIIEISAPQDADGETRSGRKVHRPQERIVRVARLTAPLTRVSFTLSAEKIVPVLRQYVADPVLLEKLRPVVAEYEPHGNQSSEWVSRLREVADYMIVTASAELQGCIGQLTEGQEAERYSRTSLSSLVWSVFVREIKDRHDRSLSGFHVTIRLR